ncbi:MAG: SpoIID/LytB domain-containing protein [Vampirovibrionales bacterium]|nr:SpoIID/LytB domain-containing protein [Vampirovibrionales bacterium]
MKTPRPTSIAFKTPKLPTRSVTRLGLSALVALSLGLSCAPNADAGFWGALGRLFGIHGNKGSSQSTNQQTNKPQNAPATGMPQQGPMSGQAPGQPYPNVITLPADAPISLENISPASSGMIRIGLSDDAMTALEYPVTVVGATGAFDVLDLSLNQRLYTGVAGEKLSVSAATQALTVQVQGSTQRFEAAGPLRIIPTSSDSFVQVYNITRKGVTPSFRGVLEVTRGRSNPNKLTTINVLSLQDYLKAVVPNEMPVSFGTEALKAQAVTARNYAVRPRENPWHAFDLCDSQLCQAYYGKQTEHPAASQAVEATAGIVALYQGEPIVALFSSTHGGYSEDYANAFLDNKPYPYLRGKPDNPQALLQLIGSIPKLSASTVQPETRASGWLQGITPWQNPALAAALPNNPWPTLQQEEAARLFWSNTQIPSFDADSPLHRWERVWNRQELETTLAKTLAEASRSNPKLVSPSYNSAEPFGTLQQIIIADRGVSGKAKTVLIVTDRGQWRVSKENLIRRVFAHNGKMLPSANIVLSSLSRPVSNGFGNTPTMVVESVKAQGGGFGHGVGMSQYGAGWLGRKGGYSYARILQHYYDGTAIGTLPLYANDNTAQPVMQEFRSIEPTAQAVLHIKTQQNGLLGLAGGKSQTPVLVGINQDTRYITLDAAGEAHVAVGPWLKPHGQLNTVSLYPDPNTNGRVLKAWIELIPSASPVPAGQNLAHYTRR